VITRRGVCYRKARCARGGTMSEIRSRRQRWVDACQSASHVGRSLGLFLPVSDHWSVSPIVSPTAPSASLSAYRHSTEPRTQMTTAAADPAIHSAEDSTLGMAWSFFWHEKLPCIYGLTVGLVVQIALYESDNCQLVLDISCRLGSYDIFIKSIYFISRVLWSNRRVWLGLHRETVNRQRR